MRALLGVETPECPIKRRKFLRFATIPDDQFIARSVGDGIEKRPQSADMRGVLGDYPT